MANSLFDSAREAFLGGDLDWDGSDIRVILVDHTDDTPAPATDDFLDDIASGARVATSSSTMSSLTITNGVADAADETLSSVSGDDADSIVIYEHTGTESTSHLIAFIDTATGLPVTPNGGDITIQWDSGSNKIFKL